MGSYPPATANPLQSMSLLWQRGLAVGLTTAVGLAVADYPYASIWLGLLLSAYAVGLWLQPSLWLLVLPVLVPLLNLAPWSGRYFLEDFDCFVGLSIASSLWRGEFRPAAQPRLAKPAYLLPGLLLFTHLLAMWRGMMPMAALDGNAFSSYYSPYNALRVGKALLASYLLFPSLLTAFSQRRQLARQLWVSGISLGVIGMGIVVLWERGVFGNLLYGNNIYEKLHNLTDFSNDYRITGLFADMHTGGEAIDGYLALSWPFGLAALLLSQTKRGMALGLCALAAGLYAALVTFSRGTYLAVGVSLLAFALLYWANGSRPAASAKALWPAALSTVGAAVIAALLYAKGGHYALLAGLGIFTASALLGYHGSLPAMGRLAGLGLVFVGGLALMMRGMLTSKWVHNSVGESVAYSLPAGFLLLAAGLGLGALVHGVFGLRQLGTGLAAAATLILVGVPAVSGHFIQSRFVTVRDDFAGRLNHWQHAMDLMEPGAANALFGMGLGVFPRAYLWGNEDEKSSMAVLQDDGINTYLRLSNSMDLAIGQRVDLAAGQAYRLTLDVRTKTQLGSLDISLCRRNIIVPYDGECVKTSATVNPGPWQKVVWEFNAGAVGDGGHMFRWPLALRLTHFVYNPKCENNLPLNFIDIDNIKLMDRFGEDHLYNGRFERGLDRWFPTSDHAHLPLHIKNLWVNVWFEQGWCGLLAFLALSVYALACSVSLARRGDAFAVCQTAALAGFLAVGLIGTLYDVPRVSFLFFLNLLIALAQSATPLPGFASPAVVSAKSPIRARRPFLQPTQAAPHSD